MEVMKIVNKQYKVSVNKVKRTCLLHGRLKNIRKNAARVHLKSQQGKAFGGFKVDTFMNLMVRRTLHG